MTKIIYNKNINILNEEVFQLLSNTINDILKEQDEVVLGIPGGRSVTGLFKLFKNKYTLLPWDSIHIFMTDERIIPLDDEYSNFKQAKEAFIDDLLLYDVFNKNNIHPANWTRS